MSKPRYEILTGLNYPPMQRAEPGEVRDDIPTESIGWLLDGGHIQSTKKPLTQTEDAGA